MQYLYLIECQGFYKIGIANDVGSRLAQLSTGNPFPLVVLATWGFENALPIEAALHQRFESNHERGEWFLLSSQDLETLENTCKLLGGVPSTLATVPEDYEVEDAEKEQEFILDSADLRIEKRYNPETGQLRGFAFRERNNSRRVVRYVGCRENPDEFRKIRSEHVQDEE